MDPHRPKLDPTLLNLSPGLEQAPPASLDAGYVLAGKYRIDAELGAGGMGRVYRATQLALERQVAVKVLGGAPTPNAEQRFAREAAIVARLNHPNIVTVYDVGLEPGVGEFIVMELVDGRTLGELLDERGRLPFLEAAELMRQVAEAVAAAHAKGVIHRDLKPHNVMLVRAADGSTLAKVLDFGIAKTIEDNEAGAAADPTLTEPGMILGTPLYLSPEQARSRPVDARTDVWSMGVMLYQLLTGELPFMGPTRLETVVSILRDKPVPITERAGALPSELIRLVDRCLAKPPDQRPSTARELATELADIGSLSTDDTLGIPLADLPVIHRSKLPVETDPMLGRDLLLQEVVTELRRDTSRIVTLTGPGGTGKTRLALGAARELLPDFEGGVFFVNLSAVRDTTLVVPTIARELDAHESAGSTPANAIAVLVGSRPTLIVLDNFEQVVDAAPDIAHLVNETPGLKVLVTSRARLHILTEREVVVPPLALPPAGGLQKVEDLTSYPAVALFVERARASRKSFELNERNAAVIGEICRRLDGLPLAIELAAARLKMLSPEGLLSRLDARLRLLTGGARDLPERQQTMRAAIAWSDDLLGSGERKVFYRLSVFAGGCTLDDAEAICAGDGAAEVMDALETLVEASLVDQRETSSGDARFRMLEVVREYAHERLETTGEAGLVERRHAETYSSLAGAAVTEVHGKDRLRWLERLDAEIDNLRCSLATWNRDDDAKCLELAWAMNPYLSLRGQVAEANRWLSTALDRGAGAPAEVRVKAMYAYASNKALEGEHHTVRTLATRVAELAEEIGDQRRLGAATWLLGRTETCLNNVAESRAYLERAMAIAHEIDHRGLIEHCLNSLGELARITGEFPAARDYYQQAVELMRSGGTEEVLVSSLSNLGAVAVEEGDFAEARARYGEALRLAHEQRNPTQSALALDGLAAAAAGVGDWRLAARLAGAAEALCAEILFNLEPLDQQLRDRTLEKIRGALGDEGLAAALADGRALPVDEAVREALQDE